jgi:hypothetical protein
LALLGITVVQVFEITLGGKSSDGTSHSTGEQIVGVALLVFSIFFNSGALIIEKIIFNKYKINPLRMVFSEGIFGMLIMGVVIAITSLVPCPDIDFIKDKCILYDK